MRANERPRCTAGIEANDWRAIVPATPAHVLLDGKVGQTISSLNSPAHPVSSPHPTSGDPNAIRAAHVRERLVHLLRNEAFG